MSGDRAYNPLLTDLFVLQSNVIRIINGIPTRTSTEYLYTQQNFVVCETFILL